MNKPPGTGNAPLLRLRRDFALRHSILEPAFIRHAGNQSLPGLLHIAPDEDRRTGWEMREHIGPRQHIKIARCPRRFKIRIVVVGVLENAIPPV